MFHTFRQKNNSTQKMKKIVLNLSLVLATAFMLASCNSKTAETAEGTTDSTAVENVYTINTDASSKVEWKGEMLKMYSHSGTLVLKEGSLTTKGGAITAGTFTVDLTTITPTDSNYDNKDKTAANLVGHLSSPDFFDVANNPTATFVINSLNGNEATGTLTIRGKSNEETLKNIVLTETDGTVTATGTINFDRQKYGVAFKMTVKDMVLGDDIALDIAITGKK